MMPFAGLKLSLVFSIERLAHTFLITFVVVNQASFELKLQSLRWVKKKVETTSFKLKIIKFFKIAENDSYSNKQIKILAVKIYLVCDIHEQ